MSPKFNILVFVLCFVQCIRSEGYYTIVAPQTVRANSEYHVSVNSQGLQEPITVKVGIEGKSPGGDYSEFKTVTVEPHTTQLVQLDIGNVSPGDYKLVAEGLSGLIFTNKSEIGLNTKAFSIFVQTDKSIYKPGDTVKFRVLALDSNLKPAALKGGLNVFIQDSQNNRLKQWNKVETTKGVFSGEMELSTAPVLGTWSINVNTEGSDHEKKFDVDEYVLPKFEVIVDSTRHSTLKEGKITATIRAKYTYGKFVKGEVTVSAYPTLYVGSLQPFAQSIIQRKVLPIDGKALVEFDIVGELGLEGEYERDVVIEAVVEEALTGRRQNSSSTVTLHKSKYKIDFVSDSSYYRPGIPYVAFVKVSQHDGAPVQDAVNKVELTYRYGWERTETPLIKQLSLDEHGMSPFTVEIDANTTYLSIEAKYLDVTGSHYVSRKDSPNNVYLQAKVKTENPTVNKEVTVEVVCTDNLEYLTYQVIGRGDIISTNTVEVPAGSKTHTFKFLATFAMVPKAKVLVYFIHQDGQIIFDTINVEFPAAFQNTVKVALSSAQAKPGANIDITVTTKPNSFVGLLGVDQSVLLLKKGNDLDRNEIFDELKNYETKDRPSYGFGGPWGRPIPIQRIRRQVPPFDSEPEYFPDFENAGTVVLTNAKSNHRRYRIYYSMAMPRVGLGGSVRLHPSSSFGGPQTRPSAGISITIRKEFPETWLYDIIDDNGFEGKTTLHKKVPDTITSWIITGFAIDPVTGFGMTQNPRKLEVFQPFFVSTNLPYSIKRGEVVAIPIVVFNYMNEDVVADVTLDNELQEFEFAEISNEVNPEPNVQTSKTKNVRIKANNGASVSFMIKPKKAGHITIKVTAVSPLAGDGVEKQLLVVPEGVPQFINKALFIDLREQSEFNQEIEIEIPRNAVPDSTRIELSVVGDLLGPTVKNLDKLIRIPYGCGEQNMLNFVPNIVILNYLKVTDQLTKEIEGKSLQYMEKGYQRELTYKHPDGSFSAFGKSDDSGSSWLTAFVARSFNEASKFIDVDEKIVNEALSWLSKQQAENGSFPEVGRVIHKDMQGGSGSGISLTAYTLITFLENKKSGNLYQNTINKALDYIVRNLEGLDDVYSLALAAYALQLSEHSSKATILATLQAKATNENSKTWWMKPIATTETDNPHTSKPNAVNVEISAYALLAYLEAGLVTEGLPIMKWLITQRNDQGGFQSTQDTVIGLKALAEFAAKIVSPTNNVQVSAKFTETEEATLNVNKENAMVLQSRELPSSVRKVMVRATGRGFAMAQISYKYNVNVTGAWPRFTLDPQVHKNSNQDYLQLTVCTSYIPLGNDTTSNMAVMEVAFPSGFTADADTLPSLQTSHGVKRVETKNSDTVVVMYFDNLERTEVCPTLTGFRTHKVANQKPAPVTVYDYYDNSREARMFYQVQEASLCDICEGEDCSESCTARAEQQVQNTNLGNNSDPPMQSSATDLKSGFIIISAFALLKAFF